MEYFTSRSLVWIHPPDSTDWKPLPLDCFSVAYLTWAGGPSLVPNRWLPTSAFSRRISRLLHSEQNPPRKWLADAWFLEVVHVSQKSCFLSSVKMKQLKCQSRSAYGGIYSDSNTWPYNVDLFINFENKIYLPLATSHVVFGVAHNSRYHSIVWKWMDTCYPTANNNNIDKLISLSKGSHQ